MSHLVSITVTVHNGNTDETFNVDINKDCALVWGPKGWEILADHYKHVHVDAAKERKVREKTCPKATPRPGSASVVAPMMVAAPADPVIALKTPDCDPTQWP